MLITLQLNNEAQSYIDINPRYVIAMRQNTIDNQCSDVLVDGLGWLNVRHNSTALHATVYNALEHLR